MRQHPSSAKKRPPCVPPCTLPGRSFTSESSSFLNMSSILGIDPEPEHFDTVAYATSKGGIVAMSRSIAASCAKEKIRVNVIAPSLVRTPMSARASEDQNILDFLRVKHP
jgi:NAD(P)-dependent dehydrogenase (short-subunit alcohol dehydrogenase family)